jgi:hypothetical protein
MPFSGQSAYTTYMTPKDQDVVATLVELIGAASRSLRFMIYACTLPEFYDAVVAQDQAGMDCKGLFDHSQASTPAMHEALVGFYHRVRDPSRYLIGTSPVAHQYMHLKGLWVNHSAQTPFTGTVPLYSDWHDAVAAKAPVTWSGSWNFTKSASRQINNADILPGHDRGAAFDVAFEEVFAYVGEHEPQYQIVLEAMQRDKLQEVAT